MLSAASCLLGLEGPTAIVKRHPGRFGSLSRWRYSKLDHVSRKFVSPRTGEVVLGI